MGKRTHRVRWGENLSDLAQTYYGDPAKWTLIYQANRHYIANPNQLDPGQVLVVPHELVAGLHRLLDPA